MRIRSAFAALAGAAGLLAVSALLPGCSSGGSSAGGGGGTRATSVYVTDKFSDDWSQVLVTLYSIDGSTDGTTYTNLYSNSSGQVIDVASLSQSAMLLSQIKAPAGGFKSLRVTFGNVITLVPKGGGSPQQVTVNVSGPNISESGNKVTVLVQSPQMIDDGDHSSLVVDFKLAAFTLVGGKVHAEIDTDDSVSFHGKKLRAHLEGLVSNYVAGTSFDLTLENGNTAHVLIVNGTLIGAANGAPALGNGVSVEVEGTPNADGSVTASLIRVKSGSEGDHPVPGVSGLVVSVDTTGNFVMDVGDADHFDPLSGSVTVHTDQNTTFALKGATSASFSNIATGVHVKVVGTYDQVNKVLNATAIYIHDED